MVEPEKESGVKKLPEAARKNLLFWLVTILMVIIIGTWLVTVRQSILNSVDQPGTSADSDWQNIKKNLTDLLDTAKHGYTEIQQQIVQVTAPIATSTASDDQINQIKNQLITNQTKDWLTFHDTTTDCIIKYPSLIVPTVGKINSTVIVSFRRFGELTDFLQIKKYATTTDFTQTPNVRMVIKKNNYFLVAVTTSVASTSDATTTLMLATFQ